MFYKLGALTRDSDYSYEYHNPIELYDTKSIPSIKCPRCGIWSSSDMIRIEISESAKAEFAGIKILPLADWMAKRKYWGSILGMAPDLLSPGMHVGLPVYRLRKKYKLHDVIVPYYGKINVSENVKNVLVEHSVLGVNFVPSIIKGAINVKYYELDVVGKAWRVGVDYESLVVCNLCKRRTFIDKPYIIDIKRRDGSDFFNVDLNPNRIFTTKYVYDIFKKNNFSNYEFKDIRSSEEPNGNIPLIGL